MHASPPRSSTRTAWRTTCEAPRHRGDRLPRLARLRCCASGPRRGGASRPGRCPSVRRELDPVRSTPATPPPARWSRAAPPCCTSRASPTRRARATTRPAPCARTRARPSTCSRAVPSTALGSSTPRPSAPRSSRRRTSTRFPSASARSSAASIPLRATVVRFTSVFGPGQLVDQGATGAIAVVRRQGARGRADRHPGRPAARPRLRLRGRRRRCARADRRRRALERDASRSRAASRHRCCARLSSCRDACRQLGADRDARRGASAGRERELRRRRAARFFRPAPRRSYPCLCRLAAVPLLKAAPEREQIADRLDGGDWRGLELCLARQARRERRGRSRRRSRRLVGPRRAPSPPSRRSLGRAAPSSASTGWTTRRARASTAAPASPPRSAPRSSPSTSSSRSRPRSSAPPARSTRARSRSSCATTPTPARRGVSCR